MTSQNNTKMLSQPHWRAAGAILLTLIGLLANVWPVLAGCDPAILEGGGYSRFFTLLASSSAFAILGTLIFVYRPHNRIGWLCLATGIGLLYGGSVDFYVTCGLTGAIIGPGLAYAAWFSYGYGIFNVLPMFILLPMVYPTGRFLSPRWRWVTIIGIAMALIGGTALGLLPDFSRDNGFEVAYPVTNPFGIPSLPVWWYSFFRTVASVSFISLVLIGIASMFIRFRRSVGDERQQMKWLAYFLITAVATQIVIFEIPRAFIDPQITKTIWYQLIIGLVFVGMPFIIGIAIFKYRLYDIDLVIRRTLIYGLLTGLLAFVYFGSILVTQTIFHSVTGRTENAPLVIVISTLMIAALFNPLRVRIQAFIDRRFYRRKYDAAQTLAQFARAARDEVDLNTLTTQLTAVIQDTIQPTHVSLWLKPKGKKVRD